jgi:hypothetical protein
MTEGPITRDYLPALSQTTDASRSAIMGQRKSVSRNIICIICQRHRGDHDGE